MQSHKPLPDFEGPFPTPTLVYWRHTLNEKPNALRARDATGLYLILHPPFYVNWKSAKHEVVCWRNFLQSTLLDKDGFSPEAVTTIFDRLEMV
jgi:hypothetical protein